MIRLFFTSFILATLISCANHYYRNHGDEITLILQKRGAQRVSFFCSLDGYSPRPVKNISGQWQVKMPANKAFRYFYRIDDQLFVPDCRLKEKDDFGWENCIYEPDS